MLDTSVTGDVALTGGSLQIGDDQTAAEVFEAGGLVWRMEAALSRMTERADQARAVRKRHGRRGRQRVAHLHDGAS